MSKKPTNDSGILARLKSVYNFMTQNNLDSVEIDEADLHVRMARRKAVAVQVPVAVPAMGIPAAAQAVAQANGNPPAAALPPGAATLKSSMMGIFYRAPSPSSPPFVKEGDSVKTGQLLCMIEAMKVFNEIKAEYPCKIVRVLLENGKPVKSGQDIFLIERL